MSDKRGTKRDQERNFRETYKHNLGEDNKDKDLEDENEKGDSDKDQESEKETKQRKKAKRKTLLKKNLTEKERNRK